MDNIPPPQKKPPIEYPPMRKWAKPSQDMTIRLKGKLPDKEPRKPKSIGHYSRFGNKDIYIGLTASISIMIIVFLIIIFKDQL